jgi:hypothetical protein
MSNVENKRFIIDVKALSLEKEQHVEDLLRFLTEQLPQIELSRTANEVEVILPQSMSKITIKLRLKKFLHQKSITDQFRPISFRTADHEGYMIKEKKAMELSYY